MSFALRVTRLIQTLHGWMIITYRPRMAREDGNGRRSALPLVRARSFGQSYVFLFDLGSVAETLSTSRAFPTAAGEPLSLERSRSITYFRPEPLGSSSRQPVLAAASFSQIMSPVW